MTRFLGIIVVLAVVIAAIGYFRGWFRAESHDANGRDTVTVTVDKDKLNQDKAGVQQEVRELEHK